MMLADVEVAEVAEVEVEVVEAMEAADVADVAEVKEAEVALLLFRHETQRCLPSSCYRTWIFSNLSTPLGIHTYLLHPTDALGHLLLQLQHPVPVISLGFYPGSHTYLYDPVSLYMSFVLAQCLCLLTSCVVRKERRFWLPIAERCCEAAFDALTTYDLRSHVLLS